MPALSIKSTVEALSARFFQLAKLNNGEYEPTKQSINNSINQPTNQPINQSINQSIDQSINRSISQSLNQSINQSINGYLPHVSKILQHCSVSVKSVMRNRSLIVSSFIPGNHPSLLSSQLNRVAYACWCIECSAKKL